MSDQIAIVEAFLATWDTPGGWERGVQEYFSDDSVYENIGMSKSVGIDEILEFARHYDRTTGGGIMHVRTSAIACAGHMVLTERVDDMVDGHGNVFFTTPVMGAFEVRNGKIVAWRDYFDTASLPQPYDGPGALS